MSAIIRAIVSDAQRHRWEAVAAAVVLDVLAPRDGCSWRPVCCICVDSLDVASMSEVEAYRVNKDTGHNTGGCSFCGYCGRDTMVAAIHEDVFESPPAAYLESRRGYHDRGGRFA